jgi:hypothetical protein
MDNTGAYLTYQELFDKMFPSSLVSYKSFLTLSTKVGNVFEYTGSSFVLQQGDIVTQGEFASEVTALQTTPTRLTLADGTNFANGSAKVYRTSYGVSEWTAYRSLAMQQIDLITGQWFNKRSFSGASALKFEGNNTYILHFPVPIIEIVSLKLNDSADVMDSTQFEVFKSRTLPDDRRNPRLKIKDSASIFSYGASQYFDGIFYQGRSQTIEGAFGFLEADGSTPEGIKWCTARLVTREALRSPGNIFTLPIKSEKTDLHEIEYDVGPNVQRNPIHGMWTGDDEIDRVLRMYKCPLAIGAPNPMFSTIVQFYETNRTVW